jgi:hypothetical protein
MKLRYNAPTLVDRIAFAKQDLVRLGVASSLYVLQ